MKNNPLECLLSLEFKFPEHEDSKNDWAGTYAKSCRNYQAMLSVADWDYLQSQALSAFYQLIYNAERCLLQYIQAMLPCCGRQTIDNLVTAKTHTSPILSIICTICPPANSAKECSYLGYQSRRAISKENVTLKAEKVAKRRFFLRERSVQESTQSSCRNYFDQV